MPTSSCCHPLFLFLNCYKSITCSTTALSQDTVSINYFSRVRELFTLSKLGVIHPIPLPKHTFFPTKSIPLPESFPLGKVLKKIVQLPYCEEHQYFLPST